jgi:hypothetical protein
LRRLFRGIEKVDFSIIVVSDVPVEALHHKIIVLVVNSHEKVTHPDFDPHSIKKILPVGLFVI